MSYTLQIFIMYTFGAQNPQPTKRDLSQTFLKLANCLLDSALEVMAQSCFTPATEITEIELYA